MGVRKRGRPTDQEGDGAYLSKIKEAQDQCFLSKEQDTSRRGQRNPTPNYKEGRARSFGGGRKTKRSSWSKVRKIPISKELRQNPDLKKRGEGARKAERESARISTKEKRGASFKGYRKEGAPRGPRPRIKPECVKQIKETAENSDRKRPLRRKRKKKKACGVLKDG